MIVPVVVIAGVGYWFATRQDIPRLSGVTTQQARVVTVSGATPVVVGDRCMIRIEPSSGRPYNCRVVVRCGAQILYGALENNGYATCTVEGGVAVRAEESVPNDSDPDLHYDRATSRATVKDPTWQVDLELLPESSASP